MAKKQDFLFLNSDLKFFPILKAILKKGGMVFLVGGVVRDLILGCRIKDIDIEVHNLSLGDLQEVLSLFGEVKLVGKQFGVLRLLGLDIDWSLPRKDSKGRKPLVFLDPSMTIVEACHRRDLTMNAMAINLDFLLDDAIADDREVEVIDPFGGLKDLKDKKLRMVDESLFLEDPLRFFRVMQFIGRFEMMPDDKLSNVCRSMSLDGVARERVCEELQKLFLKSKRPSLGFRWLKDIDRLKEIMPEVYDLIGVKQMLKWHPEGDVFEHTMQALDAAAILDEYKNKNEKLKIMFAVLCHDFGKVKTMDKDCRSIGHEQVGVDIARSFIKRFCNNRELLKAVAKLVRYHLALVDFIDQGASLRAYKRLANKLAPEVSLRQLVLVAICDKSGRNPKGGRPLKLDKELFEKMMRKIKESSVENGPEEPVLRGRDLIGLVTQGPRMGHLLAEAYQIQIDEGIRDINELKRRVLKIVNE